MKVESLAAPGEVIGTSKLERNDDGVWGKIKADLTPDHAFTVWIKVDSGSGFSSGFFGDSSVIPPDGRVEFNLRVPKNFGLNGGVVLTDPKNDTVQFILRSHGPAGGDNETRLPQLTTNGKPCPCSFSDVATIFHEPHPQHHQDDGSSDDGSSDDGSSE